MGESDWKAIVIGTLEIVFTSYERLLSEIESAIGRRDRCLTIGYANSHTVTTAAQHTEFRNAVTSQRITYGEGFGVHAAAWLLGYRTEGIITNSNATDFNMAVLTVASHRGWNVFIVGGTDDLLRRVEHVLSHRFPGIHVAGTCNGYQGCEDTGTIRRINESRADLLLLAMGHPRQEVWLMQHAADLHVPVVLTVGGFFEFLTGNVTRAPSTLQTLRLEWLFRLMMEPHRLWRRYIFGIPIFISIILTQRLRR